MFSIFKKNKESIISLFQENFVDIHSHLLPAIDDGSKSLEESAELIQQMQGYGIHHFIMTPHVTESVWENSSTDIIEKLEELKSYIKQLGMDTITLRVAAEYMLDGNFLNLLKNKDLLPIKDSKILVEMSFRNAPLNLFDLLFEIQTAGYQPILAHPERYFFYHEKFNEYYRLKEAGCFFQLNLLSLSNYYGKKVQKIALRLLEENMIDFVGTDAHGKRHLDYLEQINNKKVLELIRPILRKNSSFL